MGDSTQVGPDGWCRRPCRLLRSARRRRGAGPTSVRLLELIGTSCGVDTDPVQEPAWAATSAGVSPMSGRRADHSARAGRRHRGRTATGGRLVSLGIVQLDRGVGGSRAF